MPVNPRYNPKTGSGYRAGGSGGHSSRGGSGKPPKSLGSHRRPSQGCPILVVFMSMMFTAIKWILVKRRI